MNDPKIKGWKFGICWNTTLPPIIMEVENDPKWKETKKLEGPISTSMIMRGRVKETRTVVPLVLQVL